MEWLKEFLGDELYAQVESKLKGTDKVKLANLANGEYVSKQKFDDKATEVATLTNQITSLTEEVKKFEGVDVEKLNQKIKDLETQRDEEINKLKTEAAAKEIVNGYKFTSKAARESALNNLINKNLKLEGEKLLGAEDFMKELQTSDPDSFVKDEDQGDGIVVHTGTDHKITSSTSADTMESAVNDFYK